MTVEQFDPQTPKKSSNSAESQTTTLDIPSKMIEEQHNEVVSATNETNRAAKVGFVSLGWPRKTLKPQFNLLINKLFVFRNLAM